MKEVIIIETGRPRKDITVERDQLTGRKWYTVPEVVEMTGIHKHTIQARLRDGTLAGRKIGGIWRIYPDALVNDKVDADLNIETEVKSD